MAKLAFIGLGVMGFPMAGHLARAGHQVTVFNRTREKAERWRERFGGKVAESPRKAAEGAELVFTCVGRDQDLREVSYGEQGLLAGLAPGALFVDHTTASAEVARELAQACRERGAGFVDAPVSGGQSGAEEGRLTIMCGGAAEDFARAEPILRAYGRQVVHMGPTGSGQLTKMVNQIAIAGLLQALAEAIHFAQRAGLDTDRVYEVISKGAAQSWQMDHRWHTMVRREFAFGFAVDWMRKDLDILLQEARRNGASLPVTALVDQFYRLIQDRGGGRLDTSSLILHLVENAER